MPNDLFEHYLLGSGEGAQLRILPDLEDVVQGEQPRVGKPRFVDVPRAHPAEPQHQLRDCTPFEVYDTSVVPRRLQDPQGHHSRAPAQHDFFTASRLHPRQLGTEQGQEQP